MEDKMSHYIQAKAISFAGKTKEGEKVVATFIYGGDNNVWTSENTRSRNWELYSVAYSKMAHTDKMLSYIASVNSGGIKMNGLTTTKDGYLSLAFAGFVRMNNLYERAIETEYIFPDAGIWSDDERDSFCTVASSWIMSREDEYFHLEPTEINHAMAIKANEERVKGIKHFMDNFRDTPKMNYFSRKFTVEMQWLKFNTPSAFKTLEDIIYYMEISDEMKESLLDAEALKYHFMRLSRNWSYKIIEMLQMYPNAFEECFMRYPEILEKIESMAAKETDSKSSETYMHVYDNYREIFNDARIKIKLSKKEKQQKLPSKIVKIAKLAAEKAYYKNTHSILKPLAKKLKTAIEDEKVKLEASQIGEIESAYNELERKKMDQESYARRYKSKRNAYYGNAQAIGSVLILIDNILDSQKEPETITESTPTAQEVSAYTQGTLF